MSLLEISTLSHSFGDKQLYQDVSLSLYTGEHMGIVGQNGSGKSTLLRLLLGELIPSTGHILWQNGLRVGHIDQHAQVLGYDTLDAYLRSAFNPLYDIEREMLALYASMDAATPERVLRRAARLQESLESGGFYDINNQVSRVAQGLGLAALGLSRPMRELSGGQRTKAMLARLLLCAPDVLLLDEPTNFLDTDHIEWLTAYLTAFPGSFMIVSHDFDFLDGVTNCIADIEFGSIRKYHGRYRDFVRQKEFLREDFQRRLAAQQREISGLEDYIARNRYRAATARMAQSRIKKLDKIQRLSDVTPLPKPQVAFPSLPLSDARALRCERLKIGYDAPLLHALTLQVRGGEKVAVTGFNGIGKTTLIKTLVGAIPPLSGSFSFAPPVRLAYLPQDLLFSNPAATPLDFLLAEHPSLAPKAARAALSRYGIRAEHVRRPLDSLSGGEQNRVRLCSLTIHPCNFLLLDEPTNHLDADTKAALHDALRAFPGSLLLVCHEPSFYQDLVDRVLNVENLR